MSSGPTRQFGGQSRAANSNASKRRLRSKAPLLTPESISRPVLSQKSIEHGPQGDASRSLTPLDLSLPPFKPEYATEPLLMEDTSKDSAGQFANDFIDEDALEDVEGMPTRAQWKAIVDSYLASLHPTKRHKSLISQEVYSMIFRTLKAPDATRLGTPQFRFWARKMFQLVETPDDLLVVTNGGRPVAIKEHIYDILCMCHSECGHGGRDKTCKVLREYYTWIPKELISNFVKVCPLCVPRRTMASKARDRKVANDISTVNQEEHLPGSSRFSVERLEDFGQFPSPLLEDPHQLKLPSLTECSSPVSRHGNFTIVSGGGSFDKSFIPSLSSIACLPPGEFAPPPPWASSSSIILPPLNNDAEKNEIKLNHSMSDGSRNMTLPPLMQYLSQNYDSKDEFQHLKDENLGARRSPASHIPIDPSLVPADRSASLRCSCADSQCSGRIHTPSGQEGNALQLQLYPPIPQDMTHYSAPPPLTISVRPGSAEAGTRPVAWEFPSTGSFYSGEGDNSALLSASTASTALPTPSPSGQISSAGLGYVTSFQYFAADAQSTPNFECIRHPHGQDLAVHLGVEKVINAVMSIELPRISSPPLFSPRPIKLENTSTMLELAAAASMGEVDG